jgi:hypothetical protein
MRNLAELNINEEGQPVRRDAPSPAIVREFETEFGVSLPEAYLTLLRHANGGHPQLDSVEPMDNPKTGRWAVNWFYHLDRDEASATSLWAAMRQWRPVLGKEAVPIASDGGGNQFFLDLHTNPPRVKVCVHDEQFSIVDIAPAFEVFIERLAQDPDMI